MDGWNTSSIHTLVYFIYHKNQRNSWIRKYPGNVPWMRHGDSHLQPFRALPSSFRQGHIGCDTAAPLNGGGCGRDRMGAGGGGGCTGRTGGGLGPRQYGFGKPQKLEELFGHILGFEVSEESSWYYYYFFCCCLLLLLLLLLFVVCCLLFVVVVVVVVAAAAAAAVVVVVVVVVIVVVVCSL